MKFYLVIIILFSHLLTTGQIYSGTYQIDYSRKSKQLKFLRTKLINDSTLIFAFADDKGQLNFNVSSDFGICNLKNGEWIGLLDYSPTINHEYGDFTTKEKKDMSYIIFKLVIRNEIIRLKVLDNNTRIFVGDSYRCIDKIPLSNKISNDYKNLGLRKLIYRPSHTVELYSLPQNLLSNRRIISPNEEVCLENEYKNYVFVIKYNKNNKVEKSGWVDRSLLIFVKKETTNDRSNTR